MKFEKVINGIVKYIDRNICPNMNDLQEIGYRAMCSRVLDNTDQYQEMLSKNAFVKTFAVIDESGDVDVDGLIKAIRDPIAKKGKVKIKVPFYGSFTFTPEDIDELHRTIKGEENL